MLGNAGTLISFRVGAEDAGYLAREFQPTFGVEDMVNLPNYSIYLKLMIGGTPSRPFSADATNFETLQRLARQPVSPKAKVADPVLDLDFF